MSINESDRRAIFVGLEPILGTQATDNLLAMLPNQPASQLVTRDDMHAHTIMLRGEMAEISADLKSEMAGLRAELKGDMTELRAELKGDMNELRGEMAELRAEMKAGFAHTEVRVQRWMTGAVAANTIAVVTALLT